MTEAILFALGALGCIAMMGAMAWFMGRMMSRKGIDAKGLVRALARLRREGIATTIKTSVEAVCSSVEAERPDLRPVAAPDGTVTILFSDVEDSTMMNERLGDQRWLEVLRSHNAIVRKQVQAHAGYEVKSNGDGFMVAFASARRALECAIGIQRAFAAHGDGQRGEPVRVRIGLHTGEAIKEDGDFYGRNVILAARIADEAEGGEILVSSLVKELTASAGDLEFEEGRELELKGVSGMQRVYRVPWDAHASRYASQGQLSRLAHGSSESSAA